MIEKRILETPTPKLGPYNCHVVIAGCYFAQNPLTNKGIREDDLCSGRNCVLCCLDLAPISKTFFQKADQQLVDGVQLLQHMSKRIDKSADTKSQSQLNFAPKLPNGLFRGNIHAAGLPAQQTDMDRDRHENLLMEVL